MFKKKIGGGGRGAMHLATLMHSRLCHLLYDPSCHLYCWSFKGGEICLWGARFCQEGRPPPSPPPPPQKKNEALATSEFVVDMDDDGTWTKG